MAEIDEEVARWMRELTGETATPREQALLLALIAFALGLIVGLLL